MKQRVLAAFFIILLMLVTFSKPMQVKAELIAVQTEVRVGLTSLYSEKKTLTIYNKELGYGYCIGNTYLQEAVLQSDSGFVFRPVSGYLVCSAEYYSSYRAAKTAAEQYVSQGIEAYPGSEYQCSWRVYFKAASKYAEAESLQSELEKKTGKPLEILSGNNYRVMVEGEFGKLLMDVDEHYAYPQFRPTTRYNGENVYCIDMGKRVYRGRMEIGRYGKASLTAVNVVGMTEYLYGVVPSEMPSTWHEEALKAQAVCSRSYALTKAGYGGASNAKKGWKIVDTVSSQVYKGYLAESLKATRAVDATRDQMICYNNKVVASYFFSTSGGRTESSANVWGARLPYLTSVSDHYEYNPSREVWEVTKSLQELSGLLSGQKTAGGKSFGEVTGLKASVVSDSGRVQALNISGKNQSMTLQGTTIRTLLNLYSTKFKIVRAGEVPDKVYVLGAEEITEKRISDSYIASAEGEAPALTSLSQYIVQSADNLWNYPRKAPEKQDELLFAGMGYGHGVGMSQYGAKGMAEAGYTYREIIEYYFTGAYVK